MKIDLKGKEYLELSHTEPMTIEEIEKLYDGYWVYVVKAEFKEGTRSLIRGIPVVIGIMAFAGAQDNIFDKYDTEEFLPHKEIILLNDNFISALIFC
jgi:hypothetical protein